MISIKTIITITILTTLITWHTILRCEYLGSALGHSFLVFVGRWNHGSCHGPEYFIRQETGSKDVSPRLQGAVTFQNSPSR
jgi:hypothetical protein